MLYPMTVAGVFFGVVAANMFVRGRRLGGVGWIFAAASLCILDSVLYSPSSAVLTATLTLLGAIVGGMLTYVKREWHNLG